jgi:hypothetical protein
MTDFGDVSFSSFCMFDKKLAEDEIELSAYHPKGRGSIAPRVGRGKAKNKSTCRRFQVAQPTIPDEGSRGSERCTRTL